MDYLLFIYAYLYHIFFTLKKYCHLKKSHALNFQFRLAVDVKYHIALYNAFYSDTISKIKNSLQLILYITYLSMAL